MLNLNQTVCLLSGGFPGSHAKGGAQIYRLTSARVVSGRSAGDHHLSCSTGMIARRHFFPDHWAYINHNSTLYRPDKLYGFKVSPHFIHPVISEKITTSILCSIIRAGVLIRENQKRGLRPQKLALWIRPFQAHQARHRILCLQAFPTGDS
jgi:hypothetical protein